MSTPVSKRTRRVLAGAVLSAFAIMALPSVASAAASEQVNKDVAALVPQDIKQKGTIVMATDATYAPFEYFSKDNKIIGYDVDVSDALGAVMGLKVKHQNVKFASIIPGIIAGKYDFSMSAFSITPKRAKVIDFVGPYEMSGSSLEVPKGNPLKLSMDIMTLCGHAIGAESGTTQSDDFLPEMSKTCTDAGKKAITIKTYANQNEANLAMMSGRIVGVLADSGPAAYQANMSKGRFELAPGNSYKPAPYGIVLPKNSPLEPAMKAALAVIKKDGTLDKLKAKWLGTVQHHMGD